MESRRVFLKKMAWAGLAGLVGARTGWAAPAKAEREKKVVSLEEAWALHKKCLIIDGHNDVVVLRMANKEIPMKWMEKTDQYNTDMTRAREGGQQYVAFMIICAGRGRTAIAVRNIDEVARQVKEHPKDLQLVLKSADAVAAGASGKVGIVDAIEGCWGPLAGDIGNLKMLYDKGLRLAGITHKEGGDDPKYLQGTKSSSSHMTPDKRAQTAKESVGLTPFGIEVLKAMNELGIITDLSHINDKAFFEVLEKSTLPPVYSHTAVYALAQSGRCITDDQMKALADKGGVMGMTFIPGFLDNSPRNVPNMVDRYMDHICYAVDKVGVDYVAVGSDFDGGERRPVIPDVSQFVQITRGMMSRGFSEEEIKKMWGGNFLRVMKKVIDRPQ